MHTYVILAKYAGIYGTQEIVTKKVILASNPFLSVFFKFVLILLNVLDLRPFPFLWVMIFPIGNLSPKRKQNMSEILK